MKLLSFVPNLVAGLVNVVKEIGIASANKAQVLFFIRVLLVVLLIVVSWRYDACLEKCQNDDFCVSKCQLFFEDTKDLFEEASDELL